MGVDIEGEWWADCALPPLDVDLDAVAPDPGEDRWSADDGHVVAGWEFEFPPLVVPEEPPAPWPGSSMILLGGEVLVQPGARAAGDDSAPIPLEHSWVAGLTSAELVEALKDLQRVQAWVEGATRQALARVADLDTTVDMWSREEVAAALRMPSVTAGNRMVEAQRLCRDLPLTLECLLAGVITAGHANAIAETAAVLPGGTAGVVEGRVLGRAAKQM